MTPARNSLRHTILAVLLAALCLPACAEVILDDAGPARTARTHHSLRDLAPDNLPARSFSTLQVGCDAPEAGPACRRASTSVEVGSITRSNQSSNGVAIQETLIGTAR